MTRVQLRACGYLVAILTVLIHRDTVGREYFAGTGHTYEAVLVPGGIIWDDAYADARSRGGTLVTITSADENAFVFGLIDDPAYFSTPNPGNTFLGPWMGSRKLPNDIWKWVTGEDFEYTNWENGQPDGFGGSDQKGQFYKSSPAAAGSKWGDHPGGPLAGYTLPTGYVVEYDPEPSLTCLFDPRSTYLRVLTEGDLNHLDDVQDAKIIDLANDLPFEIHAGDWLKLNGVGDFRFTQIDPPPDPGPYGDGTLRDVFGVFSSSGYLNTNETQVPNRVPDGISISEGTFSEVISDPANNIPGDFWIPTQSVVPGGVLVRVPAGATHLFVGAADTQWFDNNPIPPAGNYGVNITRIYNGRFLGDYRFDGLVDAADYVVWRKFLGQNGIAQHADGNLDGTIDSDDYLIWREHFGESVPASNSGFAGIPGVPEPSSVALAAICAIVASGISFRRRAGI